MCEGVYVFVSVAVSVSVKSVCVGREVSVVFRLALMAFLMA